MISRGRSIDAASGARMVIARHVTGWPIELVVCSPAKRAATTAKPLIEVLGCPVRYDEVMYTAEVDDLMAVTRRLPENISSVMFVGHNPSMEEFTAMLSGASPRYPTGALGTLELAVDALERHHSRMRRAHLAGHARRLDRRSDRSRELTRQLLRPRRVGETTDDEAWVVRDRDVAGRLVAPTRARRDPRGGRSWRSRRG